LGIEPYTRHSPLLEKCCLLLSANESYQNAENDLLLLTGLKVGHSTRLRGEKKGEKSYWKEYKTARLQGIYYGAFFQDNLSLTDWVNSQKSTKPLYCLGDGHDGI
jgi:hypothetical protein